MKRLRIISLLILAIFLVTTGLGCKNPILKGEAFKPITLTYWGVWDTPEQLDSLIKAYQSSHPTIKVQYRNFRYDEYEAKLSEALWEDRLPDVFAIPAAWLREYQDRLEPMPKSVQIPVKQVQGTVKKEEITSLQTINSLSVNDIKRQYVQVVYDNVVLDNKIYGLPYTMDTLVTFYNLDLLTRAGIAEPIVDFHDLDAQTPKLSKIGTDNKIYQSAVALGAADNIPRYFDILSSIMMENGVEMKGPSFSPTREKESADRFLSALNFYLAFSDQTKQAFSWTPDLPNAFEQFAEGKLAYFFGYSYHADELRKRGVAFEWDIANFPQARGSSGTKYYANYWVNVVPKKAKNKDAAWNFVQSTAGESLVKDYLQENNKPTALRSLIDDQLQDEDIRVFASQVLTADNWYQGYDINAAEQYLANLINGLQSGELVLDKEGTVIGLFINQVNQTYKKPE